MLFCKPDELLPTFFSNCVLNALLFQCSGQWKFSILRAILWFEQKLGIISQKTCLFVRLIEGALRPIPTKNCNDIFKIAYCIPRVVLVEPLKLFMQLYFKNCTKNCPKFSKNLKIHNFCKFWVILKKLSVIKEIPHS